MALTRAKKTQKVKILAKELESSTTAIIGTFAKLTVSQDFELRKVVRAAGGQYRVLKNKLAAKASEGTQVEAALKGLKGVSAAAFTSGDPVELAKVFSKWVSENSEFTFKLGIIDGKLITVDEVKALATMPSKDELYAKLLFLISSPAQRLVTVMNATGRDLAVVINAAVNEGKFGPPAEVAAEPVAEVAPAETAVVEAVTPVEVAPVETPAAEVAAPAEVAPVEIPAEEVAAPVEAIAPGAEPVATDTSEAV